MTEGLVCRYLLDRSVICSRLHDCYIRVHPNSSSNYFASWKLQSLLSICPSSSSNDHKDQMEVLVRRTLAVKSFCKAWLVSVISNN